MITCIYYILNTINNKIYIGQTFNFKRRIKQHKVCLNSRNKANPILQNSWIKYGASSFEFGILELCSKEDLNKLEDFCMKLFNSLDREYGFNINDAYANKIYTEISHATINKIKMSRIKKKIYKYSIEGHYIESFASITEASSLSNVCASEIVTSAKNINKNTAGGFRWSYIKRQNLKPFDNWFMANPNLEKFQQYDLDWNFLKSYKTVKELNEAGFNHSSVYLVSSGQRKTHKGFKWKMSQLGKQIKYKNKLNKSIRKD